MGDLVTQCEGLGLGRARGRRATHVHHTLYVRGAGVLRAFGRCGGCGQRPSFKPRWALKLAAVVRIGLETYTGPAA